MNHTINLRQCVRSRMPLNTLRITRSVTSKAVSENVGAPASSPVNGAQTYTNGASTYVASAPPPVPELVCGAGAYKVAVEAGVKKASQPAAQTFRMGIITGFYVGIGGLLMHAVGGACPEIAASNPGLSKLITGLVGLPSALIIILVAGGDLYTGNTALVTAAVIEKRASFAQLVKSWTCSYVGNFIGCILMGYLILGSGLLATSTSVKAVAVYKTSLPFHQAFIRAIFGNWMVCLAVYMCNATTSMTGKLVATYMCIPAFVAMSLEHCIANMFMIPLGIMHGADVTFMHFVTSNLIPVTLGNTFAGAFFVAFVNSSIFGRLGNFDQHKVTP